MSLNLVCCLTLLKLTSHMVKVVMDTILAGNYEFLSYQNVCIYNMALHRVNTIVRVFNHMSLERAGHQNSDKMCGVCISSVVVEV